MILETKVSVAVAEWAVVDEVSRVQAMLGRSNHGKVVKFCS